VINAEALRLDLEREISGEVRFDTVSKVLYSTDASVYQIQPVGVVVPKSKTQVSTDLRDKADRVDALAHALADYFGRKVVVVRTNDKEEVVEPRAKRRLDC